MVVELEGTPTPMLSSPLSAILFFFLLGVLHQSFRLPFNDFVSLYSNLPPLLALDNNSFLGHVALFYSFVTHHNNSSLILSIHHRPSSSPPPPQSSPLFLSTVLLFSAMHGGYI